MPAGMNKILLSLVLTKVLEDFHRLNIEYIKRRTYLNVCDTT